jgi:tRNA threonylcarbamoyladenosine biosynthesis protein TsaE
VFLKNIILLSCFDKEINFTLKVDIMKMNKNNFLENNKKIIYLKKSISQLRTKWAGALLGNIILSQKKASCQKNIILLEGGIGAGKTIFTKGLFKQLGIKDNINSPTFTLLKSYSSKNRRLHHLDFYRFVDDNEERKNIFIEEILEYVDLGDILLVESPEKITFLFPSWIFLVNIKILPKNIRILLIEQNISDLQ